MRNLIIFFSIFLLISCESRSLSTVVDEYDVSKLNGDFGNDEAYEIGANYKGMPVFKDTKKALKQAKLDYKEGFIAIATQHELEPVSHKNYEMYKAFGWQTSVMEENVQQQCVQISGFFDIYENSFE